MMHKGLFTLLYFAVKYTHTHATREKGFALHLFLTLSLLPDHSGLQANTSALHLGYRRLLLDLRRPPSVVRRSE